MDVADALQAVLSAQVRADRDRPVPQRFVQAGSTHKHCFACPVQSEISCRDTRGERSSLGRDQLTPQTASSLALLCLAFSFASSSCSATSDNSGCRRPGLISCVCTWLAGVWQVRRVSPRVDLGHAQVAGNPRLARHTGEGVICSPDRGTGAAFEP